MAFKLQPFDYDYGHRTDRLDFAIVKNILTKRNKRKDFDLSDTTKIWTQGLYKTEV